MAYVLDTSAILTVLLTIEEADKVVDLLRAAAKQGETRVLVPFTVMGELESYLLRRVPKKADRVLAQVEGWPTEIVESYPQWRHEAVRLEATFGVPLAVAWPAALALLHDAQLVHRDAAFDDIPGLRHIRIP